MVTLVIEPDAKFGQKLHPPQPSVMRVTRLSRTAEKACSDQLSDILYISRTLWMNGTENIIAWMLPRGIQYKDCNVMVCIRIDGEGAQSA